MPLSYLQTYIWHTTNMYSRNLTSDTNLSEADGAEKWRLRGTLTSLVCTHLINTPQGFDTACNSTYINIGTFHISLMMVAHTQYQPELCGYHINTNPNKIHDSALTHLLATEQAHPQAILWLCLNTDNGWMINCFLNMQRNETKWLQEKQDWPENVTLSLSLTQYVNRTNRDWRGKWERGAERGNVEKEENTVIDENSRHQVQP